MPWNIDDVDRHKKGLNLNSRKKWIKIANAVRKDCIKNNNTKGFADCDAKAVIIANSKTGKLKKNLKEKSDLIDLLYKKEICEKCQKNIEDFYNG
jgi:uncharacterized protein YdaT